MIDGQQSDEQYMKQLYLRFRQGVMDNDNSEFYDEDELLDIYDYAQDEGDEMVQLYVFLAGARLYPNSDFLDERKAFFLSAINDQSAQGMFERRGRRDSALWNVLRLGLNCYPEGHPESELADLLSADHTFSCEAIIRLIDTLHELNRDDLIAESLHLIEEKAENPSLLYYEAAETLYNNESYVQLARDLAEELTKREPFNPDNWILLSKVEFTIDHVDESIAAADYALAIDPSNINGRLVKGIAMVAVNDMRAEAISLLQGVLAECPENAFASKALAEAYASCGKNDAAIEVYHSFMERDEVNSYAILDIMRLHPSDAERHIELFDRYVGENERRWIDIAVQLANSDLADEAVRLLSYFHAHHSLREGMEYFLSLLYRTGMFDEYARLFGKICSDARTPGNNQYELSANAYLLLCASYLKAGYYDEAITMSELMLNTPPAPRDMDESIRWKGMKVILKFINNLAKNPSLIPENPEFDPITFDIPS